MIGGIPVGIMTLQYENPVDVPDAKWFIVKEQDGSTVPVTVASVADFSNIPTTKPSAGELPYWRTDCVVYKSDFPEVLPEILENVKRRTQAVIDAFKALGNSIVSGTTIHFS